MFGRGGEEALALEGAGIAFEIVPGVSSAHAVPAYAGIPVTQRGSAAQVTFVTGHEDPTRPESAIDWASLAATPGTLVFLMGVGALEENARRLIAHGMRADTPAAVDLARHAARPAHRDRAAGAHRRRRRGAAGAGGHHRRRGRAPARAPGLVRAAAASRPAGRRHWRGETDTYEKIHHRVEHDLYYIENWSIFLDFYILLRTPFAVLNTENAY